MSQNLFKRTGAEDFPTHLKCLVSGPPKSGKTSLLGTVPGLIVLDTEPHANNLQSIAHLDVPYVTITNTDDLRQVAFMLNDPTLRKQVAAQYGWSDVGGVAIDTLDTLQKIMKTERMRETRKAEFLRDDWGWLKTEMEAIVDMFTRLPMHVFFMVHTKTQEMGKGDDSYTVTLPNLQGGIAGDIAGMVGYSLLSFRKEEMQPDGSLATKYYLRTEGDATHDFLGTRVAGVKLPTIIEPNMGTIYDAVMNARPKKKATPVPQIDTSAPVAPAASAPAPAEAPAAPAAPTEAPVAQTAPAPEVAPTQGQSEAPAEAPAAPAQPAAERPADDEPINPAALGHVKKVFDAAGVHFNDSLIQERMTIGQARETVKLWRAMIQDHAEGKSPEGVTPPSEMATYLRGNGWVDDDSKPKESAPVEAKIDGTIEQVMAYVGSDMAKAQEAYDLEAAKGNPRKGLVEKLENVGARPAQPTSEVSTPVETSAPEEAPSGVTSQPETADATPTEDEAVKAVVEGLDAVVVATEVRPDAPCEVCKNPIDDIDLAELGLKRFNKVLCVQDYLAAQRA